jgi:tetratricopeptide (TPR) repeat protein
MTDWHSFAAPAAGTGKVRAPLQAIRTEDIHRQLERICASEVFRSSLRLARFLTFVVETTLAGKSHTIKAYTIAVEAFGRGADFDADRDPIVRVEAGRLRRALARYYAGAGSNDFLVIELPRGAYVPSFRSLTTQWTATDLPLPRQPSETQQERAATSIASRIFGVASATWRVCIGARPFRITVCAVAILSFLEVLFDIDRPFTGGPNEGLVSKLWPADAAAARSFAVTVEPVIYVEPAMVAGDRAMATSSARMIRERLFDVLTRYDDVAVLSDEPHDSPAASAAQSGGKALPHYRLSSAISHYSDGAFTLAERLMDTADGTVMWARTYERDSEYDPNNESGLALITRDVAQTLLQQFGVIQARETVKRAHADGMNDAYRCVLDANIYLRSFDPSLYKSVRRCLEHTAGGRQPLVGVFVKLARLYYRDYQLGGADGGAAGDRAKLDRAYQMAARAIDVKSTSATAQFAMEEILLARGDFEQAKIASENSLRLNPYDNAVIFGRASFLILTGQLDDGLAVLRRNTTKKTVTWTGYHFLGALGSYLEGDLTTAQVEASQIASENFPFGLILDAIVAAKSNNASRAQHDIATLYAKYPSWRHDFRANVGYFLPNHDMADHIANDFAAAVAFVQLADKPAFSERE